MTGRDFVQSALISALGNPGFTGSGDVEKDTQKMWDYVTQLSDQCIKNGYGFDLEDEESEDSMKVAVEKCANALTAIGKAVVGDGKIYNKSNLHYIVENLEEIRKSIDALSEER